MLLADVGGVSGRRVNGTTAGPVRARADGMGVIGREPASEADNALYGGVDGAVGGGVAHALAGLMGMSPAASLRPLVAGIGVTGRVSAIEAGALGAGGSTCAGKRGVIGALAKPSPSMLPHVDRADGGVVLRRADGIGVMEREGAPSGLGGAATAATNNAGGGQCGGVGRRSLHCPIGVSASFRKSPPRGAWRGGSTVMELARAMARTVTRPAALGSCPGKSSASGVGLLRILGGPAERHESTESSHPCGAPNLLGSPIPSSGTSSVLPSKARSHRERPS